MRDLRRARGICPKCGSSYVIKYGKFKLKEKTLQKYRCKNCKHVWYEGVAESISPQAYELILNMLRMFIKDMDLRKSLDDAGWLPLNEEDLRLVRELNFCEVDYENMRGRINPLSKLPEEVLSTDEGLIFSDYIKSMSIIKEVYGVCRDEKKYCDAITNGLKLMFQRAKYAFWEKEGGFMPDEVRSLILNPQWIRISEKFSNFLAESLISTIIYGPSSILSVYKNVIEKENSNLLKIFDNIKPQWDKILKYFYEHSELIEFLGLVWFTFKKVEEYGVDYLGARTLVFDEIVKIVAKKKGIKEEDLRSKLREISEDLDQLIEEESWGVSWNDVFTIPW